jgi:putative membrane protein
MRSISALTVVAILAFWSVPARADDKPLDNDFLIKTAACEHATIEIAKLGEKKASSAKVKDLASRLVKDHQSCYDKLSEVSKSRKLAIVAGFEKDTRADLDRLEKLQGSNFDREFLNWMIKMHSESLPRFEAQVKSGKEAEICSFAKATIPGLQAYLKESQEIAKTVASR